MKNDYIYENNEFKFCIEIDDQGKRLDIFLSEQFPKYSRSFFKNLFEKDNIFLNEKICNKAGKILKNKDILKIIFPKNSEERIFANNEKNFNVKILAEEKDFLIISKPAGLITHPPTSGYVGYTLSDWLIENYKDIKKVGIIDRPGIIHRLDKDTSGILILALTNEAHAIFTKMFKNREIKKTYFALVKGNPENTEGTIDFKIARNSNLKHKMYSSENLIESNFTKNAVTNYKVLDDFEDFSSVEVYPITGRTHQIRVHFAAIKNPILGDTLYGDSFKLLKRHALHSNKIEFIYKNQKYCFEDPIPEDIIKVLEFGKKLKNHS